MHLKLTAFKIVYGLCLMSAFSAFGRKIQHPNVAKADKIRIVFLKRKDHFTYNATDKNQLLFFKDLLKNAKNRPGLSCDTTGEILYIKGKKELFKIYFSTKTTGSKVGSALTYTLNHHITTSLLTYNTGMIIDELYHQQATNK